MQSKSAESVRENLAALRVYNLTEESLVSAEIAAYDTAFKILEDKLAEINRDAFVQTAEGDALRRYVSLVGLPPRRDVSTASRRELVIYRMSVAPYDFTATRMLGSARAAGIEAEITEDPPGERLRVDTHAIIDPSLTSDLARERLESLLPAHLEWELNFGLSTWEHFDSLDKHWSKIDDLNLKWQQADNKIQSLLT